MYPKIPRIGKKKLTCAVHEECNQYGEQVRCHCKVSIFGLSKSNKHAMSHSVLSTIPAICLQRKSDKTDKVM